MKNFIFSFKLLMFSSFMLVSSKNTYAQCSSCTATNPVLSGNYTFTAGSTVCFTNNATLGDVQFQNNSKICVAPGVTVIIQNNITSSNGDNVEFQVDGTLQFNQVPQINANLDVQVGDNGILRAGTTGNNNFTFAGANNNLTNNGTVQVSVLGFTNSSSTNIVDNYGLLTIGSNINVQGNTTFRNLEDITIGQSYNNNSTSLYVNCGTITSQNGVNIGGGEVINTGVFNVLGGQVDFGNGGVFRNFGTADLDANINTTGSSLLYNEGLLKMNVFQGDGKIEGPATGTQKLGYIEITGNNRLLLNNNEIGPNLDWTFTQGTTLDGDGRPVSSKPGAGENGTNINSNRQWTFSPMNGTYIEVDTQSFDCRTQGNCAFPLVTDINACPDINGEFSDLAVTIAVDDASPSVGDTVTFTITASNNGPLIILGFKFKTCYPQDIVLIVLIQV